MSSAFGSCGHCGLPVVYRVRRPPVVDVCSAGHVLPTSSTRTAKEVDNDDIEQPSFWEDCNGDEQ